MQAISLRGRSDPSADVAVNKTDTPSRRSRPLPRRTTQPELTPQERRRQIVTILSAALASMPPAVAIPPESSPKNSLEVSQESP
jgi:hypothetical protein